MIIRAYMPVFNEADVLPFALAHLREQGVQVHALDGWSTDGSYEMLANAGYGVTVERFPASGPTNEQTCRAILKRIEDLAVKSDAEWCLLNDADEWRRSPRPGETLADGITRVNAEGWNVIDFRVFAFFCTDSGWQGNPESYFRFFNEEDMICKLPNRKAWRNSMRVDLASSGGHALERPGLKLCPEKWTMKHYPFRTPAQAKAKLETRLARRCHSEHKDGWGVHYDEFAPDFEFRWAPASLRTWRDLEAPLP